LIATHSLSANAFAELADGGGSAVVSELRQAQLSKHLMLLHAVARAADECDPASPATSAFRAGYRLLARAQEANPDAVADLLQLPHIGSWAHDCLTRLKSGSQPDFGYLPTVAAAAAIRLRIPFELAVPVRNGRVLFPGLGCLEGAGQDDWVSLACDGERLRAGRHVHVACAALVPDDGAGRPTPHWSGTPVIRAMADGLAWEVLFEAADEHLDRYALPMLTAVTPADLAQWRGLIQSAWELLVRRHGRTADALAEGVRVVVPLRQRSHPESATSPAAFGAIAASLPPAAVSLAETLIHEFQHTKLGALMDMVPLIEPSGERGYAPWREDPRPMAGLLQGVYAFAEIVSFWDVQRDVETEPDDILRASVLYERWRSAIAPVTDTLLGSGALTAAGVHFVAALRERGQRRESGPVPGEASGIAREVALDNWLTWQLRHTALDPVGVGDLAAAFSRGESLDHQVLPKAWIDDDTRQIDSMARSRWLNLRYQEPHRHRQLSTARMADLGPADALLVRGRTHAAVAAYRDRLATQPDPAAWIGLALAIHRFPVSPLRSVLASQLPLLFEMHACLAGRGLGADPLRLAGWFR